MRAFHRRLGAQPASLEEVKAVKAQAQVPVFVGSGITAENVKEFAAVADGLIVGSSLKENGHWAEKLSSERMKRLVEKVKRLKE